MNSRARTKTLFCHLLVAAAAILLSTPAAAQVGHPRDMTGNWFGSWNNRAERGPDGRGVIGLSLLQTDAQGTLTGSAQPRDESYELEIEGTYSVDRRRLTGSVEIREVGSDEVETLTLKGRCNRRGNRMKLKLRSAQGDRVRIKLWEFFD